MDKARGMRGADGDHRCRTRRFVRRLPGAGAAWALRSSPVHVSCEKWSGEALPGSWWKTCPNSGRS